MVSRAGGYVKWEEIVVCREKGRREVHYYLKDADGGVDLAVVGKERSARHMSYAVPAQFLQSCCVDAPLVRFPAVQQLPSTSSASSASVASNASTVSSASPSSPFSSPTLFLKWRSRREVIDWLSSAVSDSSLVSNPLDDLCDGGDGCIPDANIWKCLPSKDTAQKPGEFSWLGSPWTCSRERKHYSAFTHRGSRISVQDFVCATVEENRQLVAYVEDLYEDVGSRKMVVVRWFHQTDEVTLVLPPDVNDREIFFSLCLQDLSVDCLDGSAVVLGPLHYAQFADVAVNTPVKPFLCRRQVDCEGSVIPFDVTTLGGYWNQEILRGVPKSTESSASSVLSSEVNPSRKRPLTCGSTRHCLPARDAQKDQGKNSQRFMLTAGQPIEILSQDSGLRGCWFRGVILKMQGDRIKVRYVDLQDADESGPLEEWILASRAVAAEKLGIRMQGRASIRPERPPQRKSTSSAAFSVGCNVDAWWHDAWWEGLVVSKEDGLSVRVYFPGERRTRDFEPRELRVSLEWAQNKWNSLRERPDVASSLLSDSSSLSDVGSPSPGGDVHGGALGHFLGRLRWSSSRKRCGRGPARRRRKSATDSDGSSDSGGAAGDSLGCLKFLAPPPFAADSELCKLRGARLFDDSVAGAGAISNLVVS